VPSPFAGKSAACILACFDQHRKRRRHGNAMTLRFCPARRFRPGSRCRAEAADPACCSFPA